MQLKAVRPLPVGLGYALAAPVLYGLGLPISKLLLGRTDPLVLTGLMQWGAGLGMAALYLPRRWSGQAGKGLHGRDWVWFATSLVFGGSAASLLMMLGLSTTSASTASLLLNLESVFTALIAWIAFREAFSRELLLGLLALSAGGVLLCLQEGSDAVTFSWGAVAVVGACLAWAISSNLSRHFAGRDPLQVAAARGIAAGSINLGLAHLFHAPYPDPGSGMAALGVGIVSEGLAVACYYIALHRLGAATAGTCFALAPLVGAVAAVAWLHDPITVPLLLAAGLMLPGLWLCLQGHGGRVEDNGRRESL
jgi:drug/metabolite transporter (DMT)-like permease